MLAASARIPSVVVTARTAGVVGGVGPSGAGRGSRRGAGSISGVGIGLVTRCQPKIVLGLVIALGPACDDLQKPDRVEKMSRSYCFIFRDLPGDVLGQHLNQPCMAG